MTGLFDFINGINNKDYNFDPALDSGSNYNQYMVASAFGQHKDTILFANELNQIGDISNKVHYDFLYHAVSKKKRFGKWAKKEKDDVNFQIVMEFYQCNRERAAEMLSIITDEQIEEIKQSLYKGGKG